MELSEIEYKGQPPIDGYGPGFFRVADKRVEGALLLTPDGYLPWGGYDDLGAILALSGRIDVLFVGTGADTGFAPEEFVQALEDKDIFTEAMASPSAARTYNILLSEGRRIAIAALPV